MRRSVFPLIYTYVILKSMSRSAKQQLIMTDTYVSQSTTRSSASWLEPSCSISLDLVIKAACLTAAPAVPANHGDLQQSPVSDRVILGDFLFQIQGLDGRLKLLRLITANKPYRKPLSAGVSAAGF